MFKIDWGRGWKTEEPWWHLPNFHGANTLIVATLSGTPSK